MYTRTSLAWLGYLTASATGSATLRIDGESVGSLGEGEDASTVEVPVTVTNDDDSDYTSITLTPSGLPAGWSAAPVTIDGGLARGEKTTVTLPVTVAEGTKAGAKQSIAIKLTGRYAQSDDTLTGIENGSVTVAVEQNPVTIVGLKASTSQTDVQVDDSFDADAVTVTASFSDGSVRPLAAGEYALSARDASGADVDLAQPFAKAGKVTVTATANDGGETASFTIDVAEKTPVTPDPDPEPKPDPDPDPDPDPEPEPNPNPDPTPDPEPNPNPNPGPSVPGLSDLTETNRVADLVPVDSMVAGGSVTLRVGSAHAGRAVVVFMDAASGHVWSRGNVTVGTDGVVEAFAPARVGSYRVAVSTAGGALLWDVVSVTAKSETPAPQPTPTPKPTPKPAPKPAPTTPSKKPTMADTGASVAVVALAAVALAAAAGGVVLARRRA
ncbi:hypothetical protein EHS19_10135 [Bifidobacterium jacchi]|uniref:Uncharacterized protein n=1 Tax=Bifidobacterium jacchi TaxID=2490545 RepID=A0A5N5RCD7_9BIFI|nr:hypothetical protein EHS19_10135 [Bifidobacterium jacchi]